MEIPPYSYLWQTPDYLKDTSCTIMKNTTCTLKTCCEHLLSSLWSFRWNLLGRVVGQCVYMAVHLWFSKSLSLYHKYILGGIFTSYIFVLYTWALWSLLWESSTMESLHIPNRAEGQRAAIQPYLWPDCGYCWYWPRQRADALALLIIIWIFDQPTPRRRFLQVSQCAISLGLRIMTRKVYSAIQLHVMKAYQTIRKEIEGGLGWAILKFWCNSPSFAGFLDTINCPTACTQLNILLSTY